MVTLLWIVAFSSVGISVSPSASSADPSGSQRASEKTMIELSSSSHNSCEPCQTDNENVNTFKQITRMWIHLAKLWHSRACVAMYTTKRASEKTMTELSSSPHRSCEPCQVNKEDRNTGRFRKEQQSRTCVAYYSAPSAPPRKRWWSWARPHAAAAGRRLRRPLGSRRRLRPQASRYIPGSSP